MLYFILIVFACSREWQIFIHISSHNNRSGGGITNPRESFTNLHHLRQWARFLLLFVGEWGRKNLNKNGKLRKVAKKLLFFVNVKSSLWRWFFISEKKQNTNGKEKCWECLILTFAFSWKCFFFSLQSAFFVGFICWCLRDVSQKILLECQTKTTFKLIPLYFLA